MSRIRSRLVETESVNRRMLRKQAVGTDQVATNAIRQVNRWPGAGSLVRAADIGADAVAELDGRFTNGQTVTLAAAGVTAAGEVTWDTVVRGQGFDVTSPDPVAQVAGYYDFHVTVTSNDGPILGLTVTANGTAAVATAATPFCTVWRGVVPHVLAVSGDALTVDLGWTGTADVDVELTVGLVEPVAAVQPVTVPSVPYLHLRGQDLNPDDLTSWPDVSENAWDVPGTVEIAESLLNGKTVAAMPGTNVATDFGTSTDFDYWMIGAVVRWDNDGTPYGRLSSTRSGNYLRQFSDGSLDTGFPGRIEAAASSGPGYGVWTTVVVKYASDDHGIYVGGVKVAGGSGAVSARDSVRVGAWVNNFGSGQYALDGLVAELVYYQGESDQPNVSELDSYLVSEWGLS